MTIIGNFGNSSLNFDQKIVNLKIQNYNSKVYETLIIELFKEHANSSELNNNSMVNFNFAYIDLKAPNSHSSFSE